MVWNNSTTLSIYIIFATTSSIDLGVLVCVVEFLDPFQKILALILFYSLAQTQMDVLL
jgi:hypothetical protein